MMYQRNKDESRGNAKSCGGQELCTERKAFPTFDWSQENWWDFRRAFKELLKISMLGPVLELAQLLSKMPEETKRLIMGTGTRNQKKL